MNTQQLGNLPSNTVQNSKNDAHCMAITTQGGKQTIDLPVHPNEEKVIQDNDKVVEVSGKVEDNSRKYVEVLKKVIPMPRPPPPFLRD